MAVSLFNLKKGAFAAIIGERFFDVKRSSYQCI